MQNLISQTHDSATSLWEELVQRLMHEGVQGTSRNGFVRELLGYCQILTDPTDNWVCTRGASFRYACGELLWYLAGSDQLDQIAHYAPSYGRFSDDGKSLNGAYGPKIRFGLTDIVRMLKDTPDSRRAVIPIYDMRDLGKDSKDIPCTLSLQFLLRGTDLVLITNMRSNDAWLGFPYDVFCFTTIQCIVASYLNVLPAIYVHQAGSMHLYEKDVLKAGSTKGSVQRMMPMEDLSDRNLQADLEHVRAIENVVRADGVSGGDLLKLLDRSDLPEIWRTLLLGAAS